MCSSLPPTPSQVRRRLLRRTKCFECACALCADPDEAGRRGSWLRCVQCGDGWQRSSPPPAAAPPAAWVCARDGCSGRTEAAALWALERSLRAQLRSTSDGGGEGGGAAAEAAFDALEAAALRRLHPDHALLLQIRLARIAYALSGAAADAADAARRIGLAEEALASARKLLEPYDPQKADLLFKLGAWRRARARAPPSRHTPSHPASAPTSKTLSPTPARHALASFSPKGSEAACAAYHAGGAALLESAQQFGLVCGADAPPTAAARQLAALCMQGLKAARAARAS